MTTQENEIANVTRRVLTDNTAQSVLNYLKTLESNRAHVRTRWIWELMQNARDAATNSDMELVASVKLDHTQVVFRHNGGRFTLDEVIHLIYHGSTKVEDEQTIGQYGSGFLTTHLLSPAIDISGVLEDGRDFSFSLNREIGSVAQLSDSMLSAADAFASSLSAALCPDSFTTEFRYPLRDDALEIVQEGVAALRQSAPFVVVFNPEFSSISIEEPDGDVQFRVVERTPLEQEQLELVEVVETSGNYTETIQYLAAHGEKSSIAISVEPAADGMVCLPIGDVPRLFLGFPLIGTETFSFPAVINSFRFTPTENRDGVYLWQAEDAANQENQSVLEESCQLLLLVARYAASRGWRDVYRLADISNVFPQNWLNTDELRGFLTEKLLKKIQETPVVVNSSDEALQPNDAEIAFADTPDAVMELWGLLSDSQADSDASPKREEATGWCEAIRSWSLLTDQKGPAFSGVFDGESLASWVAEIKGDAQDNGVAVSVTQIQSELKKDVSAICWLDRMIDFLLKNGFSEKVRALNIIPDQVGFLHRLSDLHRDTGINSRLKEIAASLEWPISTLLRETEITSLSGEIGAGDWTNESVVEELVRRLRNRAEQSADEVFKAASVGLFAWLTQQGRTEILRGFPVFARRPTSGDAVDVIYLPTNDQGTDQPLAPIKVWSEDLQPYSNLFPPNRIIDQDFFDALPDLESWNTLIQSSFVRTDILLSHTANVNKFYPDHPLSEGIEHSTVDCFVVTDLWRRIDIMERVRDSQTRARLFWQFLLEWLAPKDVESLKIHSAVCVCGENHRYFPATWLEPIRENTWVRMSNDARTYASEQSLANLLRGTGWEPASVNENPAGSKLLEAIGISRLNLAREFIAVDDDTRAALDDAFTDMLESAGDDMGHLEHARQFMQDLRDDHDLPKVLAERRERRRQIDDNQRLGSQVETLVKQSLEQEGFIVRRTGVGSDFSIEYNDVASLQLTKSDRTWLVEVKSTRENHVRMSSVQASTAASKNDRFLLCVVPVKGEVADLELEAVRAAMKFVHNIGPRVDPLCEGLGDLEALRKDIVADDSVGFQFEVDAGNARVRVSQGVWQNEGFPLSELSSNLN